jgi:hypothetical protein
MFFGIVHRKASLEVRPGCFFHLQAMMRSLCKEFGPSALEVLNIVDADCSKNCGGRPRRSSHALLLIQSFS